MANDRRRPAPGADIKGSFIGGRLSGITWPPSPIQPRMVGAQPIQARMPQPNLAQQNTIKPGHVHPDVNCGVNGCKPPGAVPTPSAQRGATPHINQHSAYLQRIAQAKMAKPPGVQLKVQPRSLTPGPVVQRHVAGHTVIQMTCDECGKDKGHYSGCSRHKHNRGHTKEAKAAKKEKQHSASYLNLKYYRPNWVTDNDITDSQVKKFYKPIRGHHSGHCDKDDGEQGITTQDLNDFRKWFEETFEYWN